MICLLAQLNPQSFTVGRKINITNDSVSNGAKSQFHHFFPTKSTAIIGNAAYKTVVNNVVNIVFTDALTINQISNRNPSDYIAEFTAANPDLTEALDSHYIDLSGYGIASDDFSEFLNARSKAFYNKLCGYIIPCGHDTIADTAFTI